MVLGYRRPGAQTGDGLERLATRLLLLPEGRLAQIRTVRRWVRELVPDVIHAHSTYAGLYVRLFVRTPAASVSSRRTPIRSSVVTYRRPYEGVLADRSPPQPSRRVRGGGRLTRGRARGAPPGQAGRRPPPKRRPERPARAGSSSVGPGQVGGGRAAARHAGTDLAARARISSGVPSSSARPRPCRSGGSGSAAGRPRTSGRFVRRGRR